MQFSSLGYLLFLCMTLVGCVGGNVQSLIDDGEAISKKAGFSKRVFPTSQFSLVGYEKLNKLSNNLRIYIEGDGRPWLTRYQVSSNPTPKTPLSLLLAAEDKTGDSILYIGRPCQWLLTGSDKNCQSKYWTTHRYSAEVIQSYSELFDQYLNNHSYIKNVEVVGFSGGATVALLLAAQRDDIRSVRTVAGNLDINKFVEIHNVSPLLGSMNPVSYSPTLQNVPQLHFVGGKDNLVPLDIFLSYQSKLNSKHCAGFEVVESASHSKGWVERWSSLLNKPVSCNHLQ